MTTIYRISSKECDATGLDQTVLGGKAKSLVDMVALGLNVPPAFVIPTDVCNQYRAELNSLAREDFLDKLTATALVQHFWLSSQFDHVPLVSVRSGAAVSMPGMMDTILNVGLTSASIGEWEQRIGERAAWDSYRRLIQMLSATAFEINMDHFDKLLARAKQEAGAKSDTDLTTADLKKLVHDYQNMFQAIRQEPFPQTLQEQLRAAIRAVFESWDNPRAIEYRKLNKISDSMGTAVTVQAMVFGNMGDDSGTGVLFTRNPSTGVAVMMGEFLQNAQGEDVVAGIRTPLDIIEMAKLGPQWAKLFGEIDGVCIKLEKRYQDMVDIEFTVQHGELFILQSRVGKRSALAAFKIVADLVKDGIIDSKQAVKRLTRAQYKAVRRPTVDPAYKVEADFVGLPACPGVVTGVPVFSAQDAVKCKARCILVTHETNPDDIGGMAAARGILTMTGGATSHAAVVARAMDKPCITGATALPWEDVQSAHSITICGATGRVWLNKVVPVIDGSESAEVLTVMAWCQDLSGAAELVATDNGTPEAQRILAAYWWDDKALATAVLDSLQGLPDRSQITLDARAPYEFASADDKVLDGAFGAQPPQSAFKLWLLKEIGNRGAKLKGLSLLGASVDSKYIRTPVVAETMADLLTENPVFITTELVTKVFGTTQAGNIVMSALKQVGYPIQTVKIAVPAEYATFSVLAD